MVACICMDDFLVRARATQMKGIIRVWRKVSCRQPEKASMQLKKYNYAFLSSKVESNLR